MLDAIPENLTPIFQIVSVGVPLPRHVPSEPCTCADCRPILIVEWTTCMVLLADCHLSCKRNGHRTNFKVQLNYRSHTIRFASVSSARGDKGALQTCKLWRQVILSGLLHREALERAPRRRCSAWGHDACAMQM